MGQRIDERKDVRMNGMGTRKTWKWFGGMVNGSEDG